MHHGARSITNEPKIRSCSTPEKQEVSTSTHKVSEWKLKANLQLTSTVSASTLKEICCFGRPGTTQAVQYNDLK